MGFSDFGMGVPAALVRDCCQGAVLIGVVWIVFRFVPRIPAAARCLVWWMLCLKMLLGLMLISPVKIAVLPARVSPFQATSLSRLPSSGSSLATFSPPREKGFSLPSPQRGTSEGGRGAGGEGWTALFQAFWLTGIGVFLTLLALQFVKAARLRREASLAPPGQCWEIITSAAKALGVTPRPPVFISLHAPSPLTAGLFKPVVLLPGKDAFSLTDDELLMVLAHETAHIRRRDLWLGLIPAAAQAVFFFHPLVWLAHREYLLAREEACDALALRATNLPADAYGRLLLRFGTTRGGASAAVAISGAQAARALRRRLAMLSAVPALTVGQQRAWAAGLCVFGILCLTPIALTAQTAAPSPQARLSAETAVPEAHVPTRRLTLHTVAPEVLQQTMAVADARLAASPDGSAHVAQVPVEIRELPSGNAPQAPTLPAAPPAPPAPQVPPAEAAQSTPAPRPAPSPDPARHIHVVVPPIAPIHVHVAPIHVLVPEMNINIPGINIDIPAMPGFTGDFTRGDGKELSDKDRQELFRQWKGKPLTDKDMHQLLRQWKRTMPQSRLWERNLHGLVRQQDLQQSAQDRADALEEAGQAHQEARQEAADARREAQQDAADARQEAQQDAAEARQEAQQDALDAQREAQQDADDGSVSAQEALGQAEAELRAELRDHSSGIARQALEQALKSIQKSRKALPK